MLRQKLTHLRWKLHRIKRQYFTFKADTMDFASGLGDSAWLLYGLARSLKPQVCVEIGSARGKSACYVGMAIRDNGLGKLYAIDPHRKTEWNDGDTVDSYDLFKQNIKSAGLTKHIEVIRKTSEEAARDWDQPIDLLFIDGDHSYEGVRRDWDLFSGFLSEFGVAIFHDTTWDLDPSQMYYDPRMGVPRLVDELRLEGYPVITSNRDYGVSIVQATRAGVPLRR
jgi:predicted O-methyltransferase YrrM